MCNHVGTSVITRAKIVAGCVTNFTVSLLLGCGVIYELYKSSHKVRVIPFGWINNETLCILRLLVSDCCNLQQMISCACVPPFGVRTHRVCVLPCCRHIVNHLLSDRTTVAAKLSLIEPTEKKKKECSHSSSSKSILKKNPTWKYWFGWGSFSQWKRGSQIYRPRCGCGLNDCLLTHLAY